MSVLLYDGECALCSHSVQFVLQHDASGCFRFASLQGATGRTLLQQHGLPETSWSSVVLIDDSGEVFLRSEAALRVARRLPAPWCWLFGLRWIPLPFRDAVYDWVARHRFRWFGRHSSCWMPRPEWRERFLE
jgi:predicted DCC family thiol-disulfide oxidoreductase YuxK